MPFSRERFLQENSSLHIPTVTNAFSTLAQRLGAHYRKEDMYAGAQDDFHAKFKIFLRNCTEVQVQDGYLPWVFYHMLTGEARQFELSNPELRTLGLLERAAAVADHFSKD